MDTKLKKSRRPLFTSMFVLCMFSVLTTIIGFFGVFMMGNEGFLYVEDGFVLDDWSIVTIGAGLIAIITFIYLTIAIGRKDENGKIVINLFDKVFTEIQLVVLGFLIGVCGLTYSEIMYRVVKFLIIGDWTLPSTMPIEFFIVIDTLFGLATVALGLGITLSCIKKAKAGEFFQRSLCGWLFNKMYHEIYLGGNTTQKVTMVAVAVCILSATVFLAPVVLIVILVFAPKWVKKYEEIKKGVNEVNSGNLEYKIPVDCDEGELNHLAMGINQISEATSIAIQNEVKNQRMKTDLISNVSHDLKTPITSMVTYIDLLKTEGLDSKSAPIYLDVLEQKTNRLRYLTEDLFEAAKASSGAIPVRMGRVDLLSLVNQGLGELSQELEEQGLEFIITAPDEHFYVNADGQLLWRVVENLLGNAIKYSQEGTRVYLDIRNIEDGTLLEMKNISKQSLNIDPLELTERFKRGDESRSTEGSGLGLAIAKDLIKLMGGSIDIKIDGDLFKAIVTLQTATEPPAEPDEEMRSAAALSDQPMHIDEQNS